MGGASRGGRDWRGEDGDAQTRIKRPTRTPDISFSRPRLLAQCASVPVARACARCDSTPLARSPRVNRRRSLNRSRSPGPLFLVALGCHETVSWCTSPRFAPEQTRSASWCGSIEKAWKRRSRRHRVTMARFACLPDGGRVVMDVVRQDNAGIWIWDLNRQTFTPVNRDQSLNSVPIWMPDGRRVIWSSTRDRHPKLFAQAADGTGTAEQISTGRRHSVCDIGRIRRTHGPDVWNRRSPARDRSTSAP